MAKISKRLQGLRSSIDFSKVYPVSEAITLVKGAATAKFDESAPWLAQHTTRSAAAFGVQ